MLSLPISQPTEKEITFLPTSFLHKFICWKYFTKSTDEFWTVPGSCTLSSESCKLENLCLHSYNANWFCSLGRSSLPSNSVTCIIQLSLHHVSVELLFFKDTYLFLHIRFFTSFVFIYNKVPIPKVTSYDTPVTNWIENTYFRCFHVFTVHPLHFFLMHLAF